MPKKESLSSKFPLSDEKGNTFDGMSDDLMYNIVVDVTPVSQQRFVEIVSEHKKFIDANGGNGQWHSLVHNGLIFAVYRGLPVGKGTQGTFYLQKIEGLDFSGAYLPFCNFIGCLGEKISFAKSNLQYSVFTDAHVTHGDFRDADLTGVDFSRSNLSGCCFDNAILDRADFENCDLKGASFIGARMEESRFPGANLKNVKY
jgi:uncharacterized protein YjbI with pentapeptide repeats